MPLLKPGEVIKPILQAQFYITQTLRTQYHTAPHHATIVKMAGVQGEPFGSATPQANLEMQIVNLAAQDAIHNLKPGQRLNVYFEVVEE
jgi:hypothetical protein